jgi:uncharacterized damage-inducible protein DinB
MPDPISDRFRRWYDQERHAHDLVLQSLESAPADRRDSKEFRRAVNTLAHIIAARHIWLYRLGAIPHPPENLFDENAELAKLPDALRGIEDHWVAYLGRLTDADLARVFDYKTYEGQPFRNPVEDVLTQMFTHSAYHRGQIAMLVRQAGGEPAKTDFIYWARRPPVAT